MPKKISTNNQYVTKKEFKTSMDVIDERFDKVDKRFEQVDKRFDEIEQKMATKDDIKSIKDVISNMATKIIDNIGDLKTLRETVATKDDIRRIQTTIDSFAGQTIDHDRKAETNTHRLNEVEPKVEDHEKRITALESAVSSKP